MNHQEALAPAVIILGMHRSGTSCLAGSLQEAGLCLGNVNESAPANLKGNRENRCIMDLNENVLNTNNGSWDAPPDAVAWNSEQKARRDKIITSYPANESWGFKDPRTLLTLDGWLEALSSVRCVGTFRHPEAVARSLRARNRLSRRKSFSLWLHYNRLLLEYHQQLGFDLVCFDWPSDDYQQKLSKIVDNLNLAGTEQSISFFESALRKNNESRDTETTLSKIVARFSLQSSLPKPVMAMYRRLQEIAG